MGNERMHRGAPLTLAWQGCVGGGAGATFNGTHERSAVRYRPASEGKSPFEFICLDPPEVMGCCKSLGICDSVTIGCRLCVSLVLLTSDYNAGRVTDLALPVPCDARVIPDVLVPDHREPELGAVVEYPDWAQRLHRIRILVPEDFRRRRALRLAVQYYRVAQVHVDHILRRDTKLWRCCGNKRARFYSLRGGLEATNESAGERRDAEATGRDGRKGLRVHYVVRR